ncbi:MAG: hypothetical protein ABI794_03515 [Betaproteobacteria bacterium]
MAQPTQRRGWKWLFWLVIAPIPLFVLYTWFVLWWSFSEGERAGYVQKLSKRGWLCKTWEGELALVTMPGTVAEKFFFTVRDDAVARRINASMGRRVSLDYHQHMGIPSNCFGDTEYFVDDIRVINEPMLSPTEPATMTPAPMPPAPNVPTTPAVPTPEQK